METASSRHTFRLRLVAAVFAAIAFCAKGGGLIFISAKPEVPPPSAMSVSVETSGRTSALKSMDVTEITSSAIPATFSDSLVKNTDGFSWFVSRHFAIKTDLPKSEAAESLALLEMAWPQYVAIFGQTPPGMEYRRLAIILASDRNALERAMTDDDMHVLNLGGITQEGFSCAYLYAGVSYQTRYILLHEATHLFQYCISGNTRSCYGFFVEGIADFFSSHVFDKETHTLTINVLDRAPIHNHLAAGIEEWQRLGRPSFSNLYENHRGSRGLDVIMTAFLQSTPEFERNWLTYCSKIASNADASKAKSISDSLILSLYGDFAEIDKKFADWMKNLAPSFLTGIREFDQSGDTFISVYVPSETMPATLTLTNPRLVTSDFILDWPHSVHGQSSDSQSNLLTVDVTLPGADGAPVVAGLRFYSHEMRLIKTTAITNSRPRQVSACLSFSAEELDDPQTSAASCIAELFATAPGVAFTPRTFTKGNPVADGATAAGSRFLSTPSLFRLIATADILGDKAPQQLHIAIEALKAPSNQSFILPEDTETKEFWQSIADEISALKISDAIKNKALCALSGITISASGIKGDRLLVELQNAFPAPDKANASLHTPSRKSSPVEKKGSTEFIFKSESEPAHITVTAKWLGRTLTFETDRDGGREITDWKILGPFKLSSGDIKDEKLPPDDYPLDLGKVFTVDDGSRIRWRTAKAIDGGQNTPPLLHFAKEFGRQANNSAAYAYTEVECTEQGSYELVIGATDGIAVWNNSVPVYSSFQKREWSNGNVRIPIALQKGTNKILFKLLHSNGVWFLSARLKRTGK